MDQGFKLDTRLENDCHFVAELSLSRLLLMNDKNYPWLILVPKVYGVQEMYELPTELQQTLWSEIAEISKLLKTVCEPTKLNIGALGNIVRQLHVHVVARFDSDKAWPGPIWGAHQSQPYSASESDSFITKVREQLKSQKLI